MWCWYTNGHAVSRSILQVWYEVGKQLNVCGDGKRAPEPIKQCYNDTSTLAWLETNIKIVRNHPALLGYYICDDCWCENAFFGVSFL